MIFNNKKRPFLKGWTQVTSIRKEHELSLECSRVAKYQRQYYIDYKEYKANYFDNRRHESDLVNPRIELYYPFFYGARLLSPFCRNLSHTVLWDKVQGFVFMLSIESKQKQYKIAVMSDACVGNVFRLKGFRLGSRFIINGINGTRKIQRLLTRHFSDKSITQNLEKKDNFRVRIGHRHKCQWIEECIAHF